MPRTTSPAARDQGLRTVSTVTRWVAAGGVALAAVFSGLAARAFSGHATSTSTGTSTGNQPSSNQRSSNQDDGGYGDDGQSYSQPGYSNPYFSRPYQVPQGSSLPSRATSGGS